MASSAPLRSTPVSRQSVFHSPPVDGLPLVISLIRWQGRPSRTKVYVSSAAAANDTSPSNNNLKKKKEDQVAENVYFDGGAHYGDLVANLILGFTLLWLPLTLAAVSRALFLRYRFTNLRVTVISGLTGQDRSDFSYNVIKDVQVVPRFIGEWGDVIITLKDGTKVDLRSVPNFRQVAKYCLDMADQRSNLPSISRN